MDKLIDFATSSPFGLLIGVTLLFIGVVTVIGWAGFAWSAIVAVVQRLRVGWAASAPSRPSR